MSKIITNEQCQVRPISGDFPSPRIGMVQWHKNLSKGQAKQALRAIEGGRDHLIQLEIGFQLRLIQVMLRLPPLFSIVTPIPSLKRVVHTICGHHLGENLRIRIGLGLSRRPNLHQQIAHPIWRFGHFSFQFKLCKTVIAQQLDPLLPQGQGFPHHAKIISLSSVGPTRSPSFISYFTQISAI